MAFVLVLIILVIFMAIKFYAPGMLNPGGNNNLNARDFKALVSTIQTEENKDRIERLVKYHNQRVSAGAVNEESYSRLIKDLNELGNINQEETI